MSAENIPQPLLDQFYTSLSNCDFESASKIIAAHPNIVNAFLTLGWLPLNVAVSSNSADMVEFLIQHGADVNAANQAADNYSGIVREYTSLHWAARGNASLNITQILINHGADVNAVNQDSDNLLCVYARAGKLAQVQLLLDNGADATAVMQDGLTPLHIAASYGNVAISQLLIDHGANVNATWIGLPLHLAITHGALAEVQLLLDNEANIHLLDRDGNTALHLAIKSAWTEAEKFAMVNLLFQYTEMVPIEIDQEAVGADFEPEASNETALAGVVNDLHI